MDGERNCRRAPGQQHRFGMETITWSLRRRFMRQAISHRQLISLLRLQWRREIRLSEARAYTRIRRLRLGCQWADRVIRRRFTCRFVRTLDAFATPTVYAALTFIIRQLRRTPIRVLATIIASCIRLAQALARTLINMERPMLAPCPSLLRRIITCKQLQWHQRRLVVTIITIATTI